MRTIILIVMMFVVLASSAQNSSRNTENVQLHGIEMVETLSDDGMTIVKRPFKWYVGIGESDNKQLAIEIAQREAQSTISRVVKNEIVDQATKCGVDVNGRVCQALMTSWEQYSHSILVGCEPLGNAEVKYNPNTGIYTAKAKIGIQGDRFKKLMNEYKEPIPEELTSVEIQQYIQINQTIIRVMIAE
ncbi:MAG: hypothetical protein IJY36_06640 [Coprobacter sp.]|nr:hypothetical protein [Coprobacter sp.]